MDLLAANVVYAIAPAQTNNTQTIFFVNLILRSNMIMTSSYIHYLINQKKRQKRNSFSGDSCRKSFQHGNRDLSLIENEAFRIVNR